MIEKFAEDKRYSLLWKFVNYGRKKFYNIGPWWMCLHSHAACPTPRALLFVKVNKVGIDVSDDEKKF